MIKQDEQFIERNDYTFVIIISSKHIAIFAEVIGEYDPVYRCKTEAMKRGLRNVPIPATYPFYLETVGIPQFEELCKTNRIDPSILVHAEQEYQYHGDVFAEDTITCIPTIEFKTIREIEKRCIVKIEYFNQFEEHVLSSRSTFFTKIRI